MYFPGGGVVSAEVGRVELTGRDAGKSKSQRRTTDEVSSPRPTPPTPQPRLAFLFSRRCSPARHRPARPLRPPEKSTLALRRARSRQCQWPQSESRTAASLCVRRRRAKARRPKPHKPALPEKRPDKWPPASPEREQCAGYAPVHCQTAA